MSVTALLLVPSMISFMIASKLLPKDWHAAELKNQNN